MNIKDYYNTICCNNTTIKPLKNVKNKIIKFNI